MRKLTGLEAANLATINIQSEFSSFFGDITDAMMSAVMINAREVESILKGKGLFNSSLAQKLVLLEKSPKDFGEVKKLALDFAMSCQSIIEQKMAA